MKSPEAVIQLLRHRGLKITPQRHLIVELLSQDESHPTAEAIYRRAVALMPDVSRTTVYNTLHELVELGQLSAVEDPSEDGTRYDTHTEQHHHLLCIRCHALTDIDQDFLGLELANKESRGYRILRPQVTFYGICPRCQQQSLDPTPREKASARDGVLYQKNEKGE